METILVTGGNGFIGSHTCLSLLENNYRVVVVDSNVNSKLEVLSRISKILGNKIEDLSEKLFFHNGDIRDRKFLFNVFQEFLSKGQNIYAVIHFAGLKAVNESIAVPLEYWNTNVCGTISLLEVMNEFNCKKIIFSSSATVYDPFYGGLLNEQAPLNPQNPYGRSKLIIEQILKDLHKSQSEKWNVVVLRYFNPIGAHPSGEIGEEPIKEISNLFPLITQVASKKLKTLKIFGNDWPTPDGTGIRDFIHIMDLADAHLASLKFLQNTRPSLNIFNIGTGIGTTVLELIKVFENTNNCKIPIEFTRRREGDVPKSVADVRLALDTLDWNPIRTIEEACRDGWLWQKNYNHRY